MKSLLLVAFQASIAFNLFAYGLRAHIDDVTYLLHRPGLLGRSLLTMFVVTPMLAVALHVIFGFAPATEIVLVTLALSPMASLISKKQISVGCRASYSVGLTALATFASIVLTPTLTFVIGRLVGHAYSLAPRTIAHVVLGGVVVPFIAGVIAQLAMPRDLTCRLRAPVCWLAQLLYTGAVIVLGVVALPHLRTVADARTLAAMVIFIVAGLAIGHLMAGQDRRNSLVLALSNVNRHPGIAIGVATMNFPTLDFASTVLLYLLATVIVCVPYVHWQKQHVRQRRRVASFVPVTVADEHEIIASHLSS